MKPLDNIRVLTLACNLPGPAAVNRLRELGATVVKGEPPGGDGLASGSPAWYRALHQEQVATAERDDGGKPAAQGRGG